MGALRMGYPTKVKNSVEVPGTAHVVDTENRRLRTFAPGPSASTGLFLRSGSLCELYGSARQSQRAATVPHATSNSCRPQCLDRRHSQTRLLVRLAIGENQLDIIAA